MAAYDDYLARKTEKEILTERVERGKSIDGNAKRI